MTLHYKTGGAWVTVSRPYLKVGGAWKAVKEVWVKSGGEWERSYEYDVTPPDVPLISVEMVEPVSWEMEDGKRVRRVGRHLVIGVRSPGLSHDPDLSFIRVLTSGGPDGPPPTTQFGGRYHAGRADNFPDEPWSDFSFNGVNGSRPNKDSSIWRYKTYPNNATDSTQLGKGTYYFTAWAKDDNNNWSVANAINIVVPKKGAEGADVIVKEARFQSINTGTLSSDGFTTGEMTQSAQKARRGIWFYGNQMPDAVGQQGDPLIRKAQILVHRKNDTGQAQANVYLWWHDYGSVDALPAGVDDYVRHQITKVGTIGKGESKWFDIPDIMLPHIEDGDVKGFGLNNKDPQAATATAADFSIVRAQSDNLRTGEVHIVWTEKL